MCQRVIPEWSELVKARCSPVTTDCPKCLEPMVAAWLTKAGKLASIWCIFMSPSHAIMLLKKAAAALSSLPSLCFGGGDGTFCSFVDTAVYTRNRQIRVLLNHEL